MQPPLIKPVRCRSCRKIITYAHAHALIVSGGLTHEHTRLTCSCGHTQTWERTPDE